MCTRPRAACTCGIRLLHVTARECSAFGRPQAVRVREQACWKYLPRAAQQRRLVECSSVHVALAPTGTGDIDGHHLARGRRIDGVKSNQKEGRTRTMPMFHVITLFGRGRYQAAGGMCEMPCTVDVGRVLRSRCPPDQKIPVSPPETVRKIRLLPLRLAGWRVDQRGYRHACATAVDQHSSY